jgi:hypothetical protein
LIAIPAKRFSPLWLYVAGKWACSAALQALQKARLCLSFFNLSGPTNAADATKLKRYSLISELTSEIVSDRDAGMKFQTRVSKNNGIAGDLPSLMPFLSGLTDTAFHKIKNRPKLEITNATFYACMQDS